MTTDPQRLPSSGDPELSATSVPTCCSYPTPRAYDSAREHAAMAAENARLRQQLDGSRQQAATLSAQSRNLAADLAEARERLDGLDRAFNALDKANRQHIGERDEARGQCDALVAEVRKIAEQCERIAGVWERATETEPRGAWSKKIGPVYGRHAVRLREAIAKTAPQEAPLHAQSDIPVLAGDALVRLLGDDRLWRVYRWWPLIEGQEPMAVGLTRVYDEEDALTDAMAPPGRTCCGVPGCMGGCNFWAPTEPRSDDKPAAQRPCGCPDTRSGYELTEPSTEPHLPGCAVQNVDEPAAPAPFLVAADGEAFIAAAAEPAPVGEGAALIAATEAKLLSEQHDADADPVVAARNAWEETARILARALDEQPAADGGVTEEAGASLDELLTSIAEGLGIAPKLAALVDRESIVDEARRVRRERDAAVKARDEMQAELGDLAHAELKDAVRRLGHGLIAVSRLLDQPYPDAPEWTPWSRFVHPRLLEVRRLVGLPGPWQPTDTKEPSP